MRNWVFALTTTIIFAGVAGTSFGIFLTQPVLLALGLVAIILAVVVPTYFATLFNAWLGPRLNDDLIRRLGNLTPQSPVSAASVPPTVSVQGSGRISLTATVVAIPPLDTVRDHLRVRRFLDEAPLPNENSRRNAQTWLRFLDVTEPYLVTQLPPGPAAQIDRIRSEVSKESFRQLRSEVAAFFRKNQMAWPIVPSSSSASVERTPYPISEKVANEARSGSIQRAETRVRSSAETGQAGGPSGHRGSKAEPRQVNFLDDVWQIEAGEHREAHSDLRRGTRVKGFLRETSRQTFDFYIMDRPNYTKFVETRGSTELYRAYDRTALDFDVLIPQDGVWYLVVDTYRKQTAREISVEVRLSEPTTPL